MQETKAVEAIDYRRRHVIGAAAVSFAIGELGLSAPVMAASGAERNDDGRLQRGIIQRA